MPREQQSNVEQSLGQHSNRLFFHHPSVAKVVKPSQNFLKRFSISEPQEESIKQQIMQRQTQKIEKLKQKHQSIKHANELIESSLKFYDPKAQTAKLQEQLQIVRQADAEVNRLIEQCQTVEKSTTPEEYFLYKKKQRFQSYNETVDQLYQLIANERNELNRFISQSKQESADLKKEIASLKKTLKISDQGGRKQSSIINRDGIGIAEKSYNEKNLNSGDGDKMQINFDREAIESPDSDSDSSVDYEEMNLLKEEYKSLVETVDILTENKEIMTTQFFNGIESIEESLSTYFETENSKLVRDVNQTKEDLLALPKDELIPPSEAELEYQVSPLIQDYNARMQETGGKLSSDLKKLANSVLRPLNWGSVNLLPYLDLSNAKKRKDTQIEAERQYEEVEDRLKQEKEEINLLEATLQDIMGETMVYKQKQHELEMAMNNMRKLLQ